MDDAEFIKQGLEALKKAKQAKLEKEDKGTFALPSFSAPLENNGYTTEIEGQAPVPYIAKPKRIASGQVGKRMALPTFNSVPVESPDGQFVSALSSPSIPTCTSRGTGTTAGKLVQVGISASGDDGTVVYNNFFNDRVWFGTSTPAV